MYELYYDNINTNLLLSQSVHNVVDDEEDDVTSVDEDTPDMDVGLEVCGVGEVKDSPVTDTLVSFTAYSVVYGTLL